MVVSTILNLPMTVYLIPIAKENGSPVRIIQRLKNGIMTAMNILKMRYSKKLGTVYEKQTKAQTSN